MMLKEKNGVSFLESPVLASYPALFHAVFTRHGGFSDPPFHHLNISFGLGDDPKTVEKNRERIVQCAGKGTPVYMDQVHGNAVWILKSKDAGSFSGAVKTPRADAAVTDIPETLLVVQVADCQPVFLYDPVARVIANVHAGWRGSISGIVGRTVRAMVRHFQSRPQNLVAVVGPSLGPCCAEFKNYKTEIPSAFWGYKDTADHFDFWGLTRDQLVLEGLFRENVHISGLCTRCRTNLFFSYRKEKITGRFGAVLGLRESGGAEKASVIPRVDSLA